MKKLFCLSLFTFSCVFQGAAFAQQQGSQRITVEEYEVLMTSICEASNSATPGDIRSAVASNADSSMSSTKVMELQEIALRMHSMPSVEKERFCNQEELAS